MRHGHSIAPLVAALLASGLFAGDAAPPRPNILHIHADDHRADGLAALGNPVLKTPNLDTLVERGMVCLPSRTMLLTGRSLFRIPGAKHALPNAKEPATFLPSVIKAAGYETWH